MQRGRCGTEVDHDAGPWTLARDQGPGALRREALHQAILARCEEADIAFVCGLLALPPAAPAGEGAPQDLATLRRKRSGAAPAGLPALHRAPGHHCETTRPVAVQSGIMPQFTA